MSVFVIHPYCVCRVSSHSSWGVYSPAQVRIHLFPLGFRFLWSQEYNPICVHLAIKGVSESTFSDAVDRLLPDCE